MRGTLVLRKTQRLGCFVVILCYGWVWYRFGFVGADCIVKGAKAVMFTPSEAEADGDSRATRPGFAEINNITAVTRPFLAYVAVLVSATHYLMLAATLISVWSFAIPYPVN